MSITKVTKPIRIEMSGVTRRYEVTAKQGDMATRYVEVTLLNNSEEYTIPAGSLVRAYIKKPDGKVVYNSCTFTGAKVMVALDSQTLAAAGTALCEIKIQTSDLAQRITSVTFEIEIEPQVMDENAVKSSDQMGVLDELMKQYADAEIARAKAEAARATAENARVEAEKKRAAAETTRGQQEAARKKAEEGRDAAESARATEEGKRVTAEETRQKMAQEVLDKANEAILIASQINQASYIEDRDAAVKYAYSIYATGGVPHMELTQIEKN